MSQTTPLIFPRRAVLSAALGACLWLHACAGEERRASAPVTGSEDAGEEPDAGNHGPMQQDDAGGHVILSGETELCTYEDSDRFVIADRVRSDVLGSAATSTGFGLVYQREDSALFVSAIPRRGDPQAAFAVTTASSAAAAPVLVTADGKILLVYRKGDALITRDLQNADALPSTLTGSLLPAADGGQPWAVAASKTGFVASWLEAPSEPTLRIAALDATGAIVGSATTLQKLAQRKLDGLALARLQNGTLVLAWGQPDDKKLGAVFGQRLSAKLAAQDTPVQLSKTPVAAGGFALSARADSAGLLYPGLDGGARQALKLRRIDENGTPDGPVLNLANAPRIVFGGSIAAFGRGYVLTYRELPSLGHPRSAIRIAFINPFGSVVYDAELAEVSADAAATSVSASDGEHLLVSFIEQGPEHTRLHALRMACPGALVLCGGVLE